MHKLEADPRFVVHRSSGEGFVIGGQKPGGK